MGVGKERAPHWLFAQRDAAGHMYFAHQACGQLVEKLVWVEPVIGRIEIKVLDVEKQPGAGLAANQVEELGIRHVRVRPLEYVSDVLEQERDAHPRAHGPCLRNDQFGDGLSLRQRKEVAEIAARNAREGEVLAISRRPEALDDVRHLVEIGEVERLVGPDREPDPMRGQRNATDEIENRRPLSLAGIDAVVDGYLEDVEAVEILPRPLADGAAISDADPAFMIGDCLQVAAYSRTSSARASNMAGISIPIALAV